MIFNRVFGLLPLSDSGVKSSVLFHFIAYFKIKKKINFCWLNLMILIIGLWKKILLIG